MEEWQDVQKCKLTGRPPLYFLVDGPEAKEILSVRPSYLLWEACRGLMVSALDQDRSGSGVLDQAVWIRAKVTGLCS